MMVYQGKDGLRLVFVSDLTSSDGVFNTMVLLIFIFRTATWFCSSLKVEKVMDFDRMSESILAGM